MKKVPLFMCVLAAAALTLCGCARPSGAPAVPNKSDAVKTSIWFIPKTIGNPYFDAISAGFRDALAELGDDDIAYTYTGPETGEEDSQLPFISQAMAAGVTDIFIAPNSNTALNEALQEARDKGVRVYVINQDMEGARQYRDAAIMPVNFDKVGTSLLSLFAGQMGYSGDFAIISATANAPDQNTWIAQIKEDMEKTNSTLYANMHLVEVAYGDDKPDKSADEMRRLLEAYPNLKGVIAPTAAGLPAVCEVVREAGLAGKLIVTGLGLPSNMSEYVQSGVCQAFQLWNPPYEGYIGAYLVHAEKNGGFKPAPGATFEAGKLGAYTLTDNTEIITLESPMTYDATNVEQFAVQF